MSRLILFCAAVLAATSATAASSAEMTAHCENDRLVLKLPAGGDGEWCLHVCRAGSQVTICEMPSVDLVPGPGPDPDDPVVPDDASKLTADLIKALPASDTRHKNAIKLAGTLKLLADQTKERQLSSEAIAGVYSPLMAIAVPDEDWKHIHSAILAGLKGCPSPAACAATLEKYAAGAMSTVPNKADPRIVRGVDADEIAAAAGEYGFDWASILEILLPLLIKLLMEWLSYVQLAAVLLC